MSQQMVSFFSSSQVLKKPMDIRGGSYAMKTALNVRAGPPQPTSHPLSDNSIETIRI
jgi:hypothetical protein